MATLPRHPEMTPEQLFMAHLEHIERAAAHAARRKRLSREDTEDFISDVKKRLIDDDYAIIRKFQGKSNFRTYLTTVINHLVLDFQNHLWGKWRPSAEAERLGPEAVQLERLLVRDGLAFHEACEILQTNHRVEKSREELEELAAKLPRRNPPRRMEGEEEIQNRAGHEPNPQESILEKERAARRREVVGILKEALKTLPDEDRLIVKMWYQFKVVQIAQILKLEQKSLYRRIDKIFQTLRAELEKRGVSAEEIREILEYPEGHFDA